MLLLNIFHRFCADTGKGIVPKRPLSHSLKSEKKRKKIRQKQLCWLSLIDLSKVFDIINHEMLQAKSNTYGQVNNHF